MPSTKPVYVDGVRKGGWFRLRGGRVWHRAQRIEVTGDVVAYCGAKEAEYDAALSTYAQGSPCTKCLVAISEEE